jgi:glycosyltransferase involved in cell wall biosynthesis
MYMTDLSTISQIERESEKRSSHLLVSAILAVRNEERRIQQSLKSLTCQNTRDFDLEIIVVDGDSSDATKKIVEKIAVEEFKWPEENTSASSALTQSMLKITLQHALKS